MRRRALFGALAVPVLAGCVGARLEPPTTSPDLPPGFAENAIDPRYGFGERSPLVETDSVTAAHGQFDGNTATFETWKMDFDEDRYYQYRREERPDETFEYEQFTDDALVVAAESIDGERVGTWTYSRHSGYRARVYMPDIMRLVDGIALENMTVDEGEDRLRYYGDETAIDHYLPPYRDHLGDDDRFVDGSWMLEFDLEGRFRHLSIHLTTESDDRFETNYRYEAYDETSVDRPAWVSDRP